MKTLKLLASSLLTLWFLTAPAVSTARANLIVNGSFESPALPASGIYSATPSGWTGTPLLFRDVPGFQFVGNFFLPFP